MSTAVIQTHFILTNRKDLIQQILPSLLFSFRRLKGSPAKANILFTSRILIGQQDDLVTEILRESLRIYPEEPESVRLQTIDLAVQLYAAHPMNHRARSALIQALRYAKFDPSFDIRDQCRFWKGLSENWGLKDDVDIMDSFPTLTENNLAASCRTMIKDGEELSRYFSIHRFIAGICLHIKIDSFQMATLSLSLQQKVHNWEPLPDWSTRKSDKSVRNTVRFFI